MGTISIGQIIVVSLFLILIFGDISQMIKKIKTFLEDVFVEKKNRKKGS